MMSIESIGRIFCIIDEWKAMNAFLAVSLVSYIIYPIDWDENLHLWTFEKNNSLCMTYTPIDDFVPLLMMSLMTLNRNWRKRVKKFQPKRSRRWKTSFLLNILPLRNSITHCTTISFLLFSSEKKDLTGTLRPGGGIGRYLFIILETDPCRGMSDMFS